LIPTVTTVSFKEEFSDTNSAPLKFICSDKEGLNIYYLKYILQPEHFDYLVYEIVCSQLANHFSIKTPEIAFANVLGDSFNPSALENNRTYLQPGVICFASKQIENAEPVDKTERFIPRTKTEFKQYETPIDLIRIGIFDVHIDNRDRWEDNYNLLLQRGEKSKLFAIDHIAVFGGPIMRGKFHQQMEPFVHQKLLKTQFVEYIVRYLSFEEIEDEVERYFYFCKYGLEDVITHTFQQLPASWDYSDSLEHRIRSFLTDENRNQQACEIILDYFRHIANKRK